MSFRQQIKELSPPWLQDGQFERYLFNFGLGMDLLAEKLVQAEHMSMPLLCDASALPFIGGDLLIPQGASESEDDYRERLHVALPTWQTAGTPWAILRQALHTLLVLRPAARNVSSAFDLSAYPATVVNTKWDSYAVGDDFDAVQPAHSLVVPGNWDWDSTIHCRTTWAWSRFWFVLESIAPNDWCHADTVLWDATGDTWDSDNTAWDLDCDAGVIDSLWSEILLWKAENATCEALILSFDHSHFDPAQAAGGGINPDGSYGRWSKMVGAVQVATRTTISNAAYSHRIQ